MPQELPDKLTPIAPQDMLYLFAFSWQKLLNVIPNKNSLLVLLSQTTLESGYGFKSAHNYNWGNIKGSDSDGCDYTFFKCNELVPAAMAKNMVATAAADGGPAQITGTLANGTCWIYFYPHNKYSRFKAFESAEQGTIYYLNFLKNRYKKATGIWDAIEAGDPALFVHRIKLAGYFTAPEESYLRGVMNLFNQFKTLEYDPNKIITLSDNDMNKIDNLIQLTSNQVIDDYYSSEEYLNRNTTDDPENSGT